MSEALPNDEPVSVPGAGTAAAAPEAERAPRAGQPSSRSVAKRQSRIRELDFTRPTKFSQDQQRRIARGHEGFCRTAQSQLSAELRTAVQLEVASVEQQTWVVAVNDLPEKSLHAVVSTSAGLPLLLSIEHTAAASMIERMLGGSGTTGADERDLTEIEVALATRMFLTLVTQLSRTWQELMSTDLSLGEIETQQTRIQLAPQSEAALSVMMELQIGELPPATMTLLVPYRSVEVLLGELPGGNYGDGRDVEPDGQVEQMLRTALRGVTVELRVELGSRQMTVDEVVELAPGDVIQLGPAASGATVYADAVPIYRVRPGRSANRLAVEVLERMEQL